MCDACYSGTNAVPTLMVRLERRGSRTKHSRRELKMAHGLPDSILASCGIRAASSLGCVSGSVLRIRFLTGSSRSKCKEARRLLLYWHQTHVPSVFEEIRRDSAQKGEQIWRLSGLQALH